MTSFIERKMRELRSDYVTAAELSVLLPLSANARHAQVKRALAQGHLIRLKKGLYRRSQYLEKTKPHPFEAAQYLVWPSYVSVDSALSYHGLIPEAVYTTTCVTTQHPCHIENSLGIFDYKKLPSHRFFIEVERVEENEAIYYIAKPWKALCDYVYCYKKNWRTLDPFFNSLRIEKSELPTLSEETRLTLSEYYCSKRIDRFLKGAVLREY